MSFPRSVLHARTFYAAMIACGGCSGAAASGSVGSNAGSGTTEVLDTNAEPAGLLPSCLAGGPGLSDCGADKESCCASLVVTGGTFYRTYPDSDNCITANADPATVSSFRLDKYDVTVGRFRQFVNAVLPPDGGAGWMPEVGSGKHTHLNGGKGLVNTGFSGGYEPGWVANNNSASPFESNLITNPVTSGVTPTSSNLGSCTAGGDLPGYFNYSTWTEAAGTQENLPINCVNWYEAYAFCIWDGGGFLPSEAEWEYAA